MDINYRLFFNSTGYSIAAQEYVLAIKKMNPDLNVSVTFFNSSFKGVSEQRRKIFTSIAKKEDTFPTISQSVPQRYKNNSIGFCIFETISIPKSWIDIMNSMKAIVTASKFNEGIFKSNGLSVPVHVIPHCFDSEMFNETVKPKGRYGLFTFLSIGTWKQRKNWHNLVKGFYDAFSIKDKVCLLIKTDKPKALSQAILNIKNNTQWRSKNTAPIYIEDDLCEFETIPSIMKKADVYVCPSRGEGFGLPGLHAMALKIPLITTKYGGVLEYAKADNSIFLEPCRYEKVDNMDGIPQFKNSIWPVISHEEIRDRMLESYRSYPAQKIDNAYDYVHKNMSYERIGKQYMEAINAILS